MTAIAPMLHAAALSARLKLAVYPEKYEACASSATTYAPAKAWAVCENTDRGSYFDAIVYDSSDEILHPYGPHSATLKAAVKHSPFGGLFEENYEAYLIEGHFYYLTFDSGGGRETNHL